MTLDNNNGVLTHFYPFSSLYTLTHSSVGLTGCISNGFSVLNVLTDLATMLLLVPFNLIYSQSGFSQFQ